MRARCSQTNHGEDFPGVALDFQDLLSPRETRRSPPVVFDRRWKPPVRAAFSLRERRQNDAHRKPRPLLIARLDRTMMQSDRARRDRKT
jgi:hypothetical protein